MQHDLRYFSISLLPIVSYNTKAAHSILKNPPNWVKYSEIKCSHSHNSTSESVDKDWTFISTHQRLFGDSTNFLLSSYTGMPTIWKQMSSKCAEPKACEFGQTKNTSAVKFRPSENNAYLFPLYKFDYCSSPYLGYQQRDKSQRSNLSPYPP